MTPLQPADCRVGKTAPGEGQFRSVSHRKAASILASTSAPSRSSSSRKKITSPVAARIPALRASDSPCASSFRSSLIRFAGTAARGGDPRRGAGAVVDHDDIPVIETLGFDTCDRLAKQLGTIVGRDDDGDLHGKALPCPVAGANVRIRHDAV